MGGGSPSGLIRWCDGNQPRSTGCLNGCQSTGLPQGIGTGVFGVMSKKVPGGRFGWERESGTGEGGGTGVAFVGRDKVN